jgi:hypothetical protein
MIFISHSSKDDLFVDRLRVDLHRRSYPTWVDHVNIPPGKLWDEVVEENLLISQVMILVLSPSSVASREVGIEWREFRNLGKPIFPVKISECPLPLLLRHLQYVDFTNGVDYEKQLRRVLDELPAPPHTVTKGLELDTDEIRVLQLKEQVTKLRDKMENLIGDDQILFNFPELNKSAIFDLSDKLFIGWHDGKSGTKPDIDLTRYSAFENGVSRQHALLSLTASGLTLTDLDSLNGTFIGVQRLVPFQPASLPDDTVIRLGSLVIQVFFKDQPASKVSRSS